MVFVGRVDLDLDDDVGLDRLIDGLGPARRSRRTTGTPTAAS